ncbi:ribonuclease H [Thermosipho melanesiensis]|uniref:Ribonuclease H n=2 Tax=Thermosipho melanesiensis TaxID=46541 RepID=A6LNL9_THEM4|nr:RNase H family protein [Thermosipho melanesiensis]ABR31520.1 ribonuclease H [Thermosipho melanesiensis BI429]APT74566.1 ribonuclease H [Thermosipho melanesiensis]OOC35267.1 ribonuclease H [Thermosipho melanesiensis]OOC35486.1 ribonuclease H [Thermosipho melanesiensis]OOC36522.1 ribonuclease H [Thermosipho melanesiensis]
MYIYVDGSYYQELSIAGYAFCIVDEDKEIFTKSGAIILKNANSVVAELVAVINALRYCERNNITNVTIVHDYNEIPMFATAYRKTKNRKINSYIYELKRLYNKLDVSFKKVKAHKNDEFNNLVDKLSRESVEKFLVKQLKRKFSR